MPNTLNDHLNEALRALQAIATDLHRDITYRLPKHVQALCDCLEAQKRVIDVLRIIAGNDLLRLYADGENEET